MKHVPSYTKILTLGAAYTEKAFEGDVIVQEKLDGSQFRFGINEDGELVMASKSVAFGDFRQPDQMFADACLYLQNIDLSWVEPDTYFYCEYLRTPRHNTLKYSRVPKNNIALFDALIGGKFIESREELEGLASKLGIETIPELYRGVMTTDKVRELMERESVLGEAKIEGIVIKNYNETFVLGGNVFPLFTKYVSEEFKEKHKQNPEYQSGKSKLEEWMLGYKSKARWEKAWQYLRDRSELGNDPRDIPLLYKRVQQDIIEEEEENIKEELFQMYKKDLLKRATSGLPEWYKSKLLDNLDANNNAN